MSRNMLYGEVDGPQPADLVAALETDPFEHLLGVCRVLGLQYKILQGESGRWSASLSSHYWPGDFYGVGQQSRRRRFVVVNCETRLDALSQAFVMAFQNVKQCCEMWRGIVQDLPEYKQWFEPELKP